MTIKSDATEGGGQVPENLPVGAVAFEGFETVAANRKRILFRRAAGVLFAAVATGLACLLAGPWSSLVAAAAVTLIGLWLVVMNVADSQMSMGNAEMFEKLAESLPGMVYQCRLYPTGRCVVTYANEAINWIYEKRLSDMQRDCGSILELVHPEDLPWVTQSLAESARNLTPWRGEYRVVLPRQGLRWRAAHARVERLMDGSTLWHGFVADITAKKLAEEKARREDHERTAREARDEAERREREKVEMLASLNRNLQEQALHDSLTGVYMRRYFDEKFPEVFRRARRKGMPISLFFCDVDHFKEYNDLFGHPAGDACLRSVAHLLAAEINRGEQFVARYGGEEFVAVLPGLAADRFGTVAEKLRQALQELNLKRGLGSDAAVVTMSIGAACLEEISPDMKPETLVNEADRALYEAKRSGRNKVSERVLSFRDPGRTSPVREILRRAFDTTRLFPDRNA